MMPSQEIRAKSLSVNPKDRLIDPYDCSKLGSYYYNLTVDKVINTGRNAKASSMRNKNHTFEIKPGQVVWIRMLEKIQTPSNVVASLEQTHHHTRQGLSFLNLSLIFPNYKGYITCAVANFSGSTISINRSEHIARIVFFENKPSTYAHQKHLDQSAEEFYDRQLLIEAKGCDESFLGITTLREQLRSELLSELEKSVRNATWKTAIVVTVTIFAFTILPVLQGMFTRTVYGDNIITKGELRDAFELLQRLDKLPAEEVVPSDPD